MTLLDAHKIFDKFAAAVEELCRTDSPAACQSSLGYPGTTILQAIKLWLAYAIQTRELTQDLRKNVDTLVTMLPLFIPDQEAHRLNEADSRFASPEHHTLPMKDRIAQAKAAIKVSEWRFNAQTAGLATAAELADFVTAVQQLDPAGPLFWQRVYTLAWLQYPPPEDPSLRTFPTPK